MIHSEKLKQIKSLETNANSCQSCELAKTRTNVVFGSGSIDAEIFFIGEGPGQEEDLQALPFVGRSGKLLTRLIEEELEIPRSDCYIANIVKCRPPANRNPLPQESASCTPFLIKQLEIISPKVIITLGNVATQYLLETKEGITKLRGRFFQFSDFHIMPTFHPAAALRSGAVVVAQMRADFATAKHYIEQSQR